MSTLKNLYLVLVLCFLRHLFCQVLPETLVSNTFTFKKKRTTECQIDELNTWQVKNYPLFFVKLPSVLCKNEMQNTHIYAYIIHTKIKSSYIALTLPMFNTKLSKVFFILYETFNCIWNPARDL